MLTHIFRIEYKLLVFNLTKKEKDFIRDNFPTEKDTEVYYIGLENLEHVIETTNQEKHYRPKQTFYPKKLLQILKKEIKKLGRNQIYIVIEEA